MGVYRQSHKHLCRFPAAHDPLIVAGHFASGAFYDKLEEKQTLAGMRRWKVRQLVSKRRDALRE